jgi:hypothetical protein
MNEKFKIVILILVVILTSQLFAAENEYLIFLETSKEIQKLNIGDTFDVYVKFDGKDTNIHSITTLLKWNPAIISYQYKTDNITGWELSAPVNNLYSFFDSHNPANGIFFWDYAGFNGCSGIVTAHTVTYALLSKSPASIDVIMGNVVSGGFSGSGLISEGLPAGRFMAIVGDSDLLWDTGIEIQDNLNNVIIFPNPFVPNDGNPLTGTAFSQANNRSGIHIKGLTAECKIEIYTLLGELVDEINITNQAIAIWDAKNKYGKEVASGVYFILIKNQNQSVIKKIAVIR